MIMSASAPAFVQKATPRNSRWWTALGSGRIAATAAITTGPHTITLSRKLNPITLAPKVAGVALADGDAEGATDSSQGTTCRLAVSTGRTAVMDAAPGSAGRKRRSGRRPR